MAETLDDFDIEWDDDAWEAIDADLDGCESCEG